MHILRGGLQGGQHNLDFRRLTDFIKWHFPFFFTNHILIVTRSHVGRLHILLASGNGHRRQFRKNMRVHRV